MITIEREKLKQVLEALETCMYPQQKQLQAVRVIKEALAQPEQEPWMYRIWNDKDAKWRLTDDCSWPAEPIYTTPQQQEPRNFCSRCGKRTADLTVIHTCTPPRGLENT